MEAGDLTAAVVPEPEAVDLATAPEQPDRAEPAADQSSGRRRWTSWPPPTAVGVLGLTALLAIPVVIALVELRDPRWFPLVDHAHMELFIRDVPTSHPPQVGAIARFSAYGAVGNHPGPITFYLLWPVYQLFGADGWGLQVAMGVLAVVGSALAIWLGHRRGGWPFALAVTAMLALLLRGYGTTVVFEVWNPHVPLVWWVVYLLAVWSVLCRDLRVLPIAVVAGTVCAQNHVSYLPIVGGLALLLAGALAVRLYRGRTDDDRRQLVTWVGASGVLLLVLWLLPLVEQLTNDPGNLSIVLANIRDPQDIRLPAGDLAPVWLAHFDVPHMFHADGLTRPLAYVYVAVNKVGLLVLAAWAVAVVVAWRRRNPALLRLHLVVGVAIGLGLLAIVRLAGPPYSYLFYWAWGSTALLVVATLWTFLSAPRAAPPTAARSQSVPGLRWPRPTLAVLGGVTLLLVTLFSLDATHAEMDDRRLWQALGEVVPPTIDRLADEPACRTNCKVLVSWTDDETRGVQAVGLVAALQRQGVDARMLPGMVEQVRDHRVVADEDEADVQLHLVVSRQAIAEWEARDDAELVATARPGTAGAEPVATFLLAPPPASELSPSGDRRAG